MSTLHDLCPKGRFDEPWEYSCFMKDLESLIQQGIVIKIDPKERGEWDVAADFFFDKINNETFRLHHPEAPSRGEWVKVPNFH